MLNQREAISMFYRCISKLMKNEEKDLKSFYAIAIDDFQESMTIVHLLCDSKY